MNVELRDACVDDRAALLRLYTSTRVDELAALVRAGCDATQRDAFVALQFDLQERAYREQFAHSRCRVIEQRAATRQPSTDPTASKDAAEPCSLIGRLWVDQSEDALRILDISLLPAQRGQGIGTHCLHALQSEAAHARLPIQLHVLAGNPARRLYARLGFVVMGRQGLHVAMQWRSMTVDSARIPDAGRRTLETCDEQA